MSNGLTLHFNAPVDPRLVGRRLQVIPRPANMNVNTSDRWPDRLCLRRAGCPRRTTTWRSTA